MFENEGSEIESTSDVSNESSSDSQGQSQPQHQHAAKQNTQEVPFHEHPRWKEVMEERNTERQRSQALEQRLADMQKQFEESRKPAVQDKMYERLKGIDPEFAEYLKSTRDQAQTAEQLKTQLAEMERSNTVNSIVGKFTELTKTNKVDPALASVYQEALENSYRAGKIKNSADLEKSFNEIHSRTNAFLKAQERSIIENYTKAKQKAASAPAAQGKGRAPNQGQQIEFSKNPQEAKAQLVKHIAASLKGSREI